MMTDLTPSSLALSKTKRLPVGQPSSNGTIRHANQGYLLLRLWLPLLRLKLPAFHHAGQVQDRSMQLLLAKGSNMA